MRRVLYLFLPNWPIDRLRQASKGRAGAIPSLHNAAPVDAPFATVIATAGRRLLAAVNPAAAAAGLAPGMPLADALSFLPSLATTEAEPAADAAALERLAEWCGRYSPWTAPDLRPEYAADGVKIEITGCAHLWDGEAALVADLSRRLSRQEIDHRIAIAGSLGAAWALARFAAAAGRPALPAPEEEEAALAALPVEALRLEPLTAAGLRRVGLRQVGELLPMPRDALARRFGEAVLRRLDQVRGTEPEPLSPLGETPTRRVRLSFAEPIADPADFALAIERLTADLTTRLAREGLGARRLGLAFHRVDGRVEHIRLGTARPTRDARHLVKLFVAQLEMIDPGFGIEDMILALYAADPLPPEQTAVPLAPGSSSGSPPRIGSGASSPPLRRGGSTPPVPPPQSGGGGPCEARWRGQTDDIAPLLDQLGARLGLDAVGQIAARESHIPERAAVYAPISGIAAASSPSPSPGVERAGVRREIPGRSLALPRTSTSPSHACGAGFFIKPPRPVRLFAPPEPIEAAMWLVPDDPPQRFTWRRRTYRVQRADGPERIAEEWWTEGGSAAADALRDYYRVEDEEGRHFWLFRAGLAGTDPPPRWFVHGLFA